jgi:hypothetical protein
VGILEKEAAAARKIFKKNAGWADNLGWMIWMPEFLRSLLGIPGGFTNPKTAHSRFFRL